MSLTLDVGRYHHVSWTPGSGIGTYLIGGSRSSNTTTLITKDGPKKPGFELKYDFVILYRTGSSIITGRK